MLRQVILHVGPHKTGTTSIQNALEVFRSELTRHGICYPVTEPPISGGHLPLAREILDLSGTPAIHMSDADLSWQVALDQARASEAHTLLASSEAFAFFREKEWVLLREVLGEVDVVVLFGLRDLATLAPSLWQESVKQGWGLGEELLDLESAVPKIVGRPDVRVIPYIEDLELGLAPVGVRFITVPPQNSSNELLKRFCLAAGFPDRLAASISGSEVPAANQSIPYAHTLLLLRLNQLIQTIDPDGSTYPNNGSAVRLQARSFVLRTLEEAPTGPQSSNAPPLSERSSEIIEKIRDDILAWLEGREVIGDVGDLRVASVKRSIPEPFDVSIEEVARLLAKTLLALPTREMKELHSYLTQVEEARDWWKDQAEAWEKALRSQIQEHQSQLTRMQEGGNSSEGQGAQRRNSLGVLIGRVLRKLGSP